jgi:peptidoglycan hydrolase CwlO-like protein
VLSKAAKTISSVNTRSAQLQAEDQRLKYQLDQINDRQSRKRVRMNLTERFSNAEEIKATIDRAAAQAAQKSTIDTEKAAAAAALTLSSMCTEWQM